MNAGDISIDLTLDNKQFSVQVRNSGALLSQLQKNLESTARSADRLDSRMSGLGAGLHRVVMTAAAVRFAMMDINDVFLTLPSAILKTTGEFERATQLLRGLSNAATETERIREAGDNLNYIVNLSKNAPFQIGALTDAFVKFKAGGLDPLDGSFTALIDGVAKFGGDSETLKRASVAIQQMAGKGVISMEELRQQLGEAVPTAMRMMAVGMGMTMPELAKAVETGTVQSTGALKRMFAVMRLESGGAAQEMMSTWSGLTSRLKTQWELLKNDAGKSGFAAAMKTQVEDLTGLLDSTTGRRMAADLGDSLGSIVNGFGRAVKTAYEFSESLKFLATTASTMFVVNKVADWAGNIRAANAARIAELSKGVLEQRALDAVRTRDAAAAAASQQQVNAQELLTERKRSYDLVAERRNLNRQMRVLQAEAAMISAQDARLRTVALGARTLSPEAIVNANQAKAVQANLVANQAMIASSRAQVNSLKEQQIALDKTAASKEALASAASKAAANLGIMGKAMVAGQWVLAAMGGWVGVLTLAISAAASAWMIFGKNGEEALKKVRDAVNRGLADKDTVKVLEDQKSGIEKELVSNEAEQARLARAVQDGPKGAARTARLAELEKAKERNAELQKQLESVTGLVVESRKQSIENASADGLNNWIRETTRGTEAIAASYRERNDALNKANAEQIASIRDSGKTKAEVEKEVAAQEKKFSKDQAALLKEQSRDLVSDAQQRADAAKKNLDTLVAGGSDQKDYQYKLGELQKVRQEALKNLESQRAFSTEAEKIIGNSDGVMGSPKKKAKPDAMTRQLERSKAALDEALIRLDDLSDGVVTYQRLYESILAKLKGDRAAGSLAGSDSQLEKLAHTKAEEQSVERLASATLNLNKIRSQLDEDQRMASERYTDPAFYEKETTGVAKLTRQLAAMANQIPASTKGLDDFSKSASKLVSQQALVDLMNFGADLKKQTEEFQRSLIPTEDGRANAEFEAQMAANKRAFDLRMRSIGDEVRKSEEGQAQIRAAETAYLSWREAAYRAHAEKMKTPLQKLTQDWLDSNRQVNDMTASWSQKSIDWLTNLAITGKFEWREMVTSMLTDLLRLNIQTGLGKPLNEGLSAVGDWIKSGLNMVAPTADPATAAVSAGAKGLIDSFGSVTNQSAVLSSTMMSNADASDAMAIATSLGRAALVTNTMSTRTGTDAMVAAFAIVTSAAQSLAIALANAAAASGGQGLGSIFTSIASGFVSGLGAGGSTAVGNLDGMTPVGGGWQPVLHANGGIMSSVGSIPLRAYQTGGIAPARSPQLAIFGEGSMAEAYVPLPDGRSIPVTMQGDLRGSAGSPPVNIAITINEGAGGSSTQSGDMSGGWRQFSKHIGSMVQEELVKAKRPGGILTTD